VILPNEVGKKLAECLRSGEKKGNLRDDSFGPRMTIQITRPEVEDLIDQRLKTGAFKDAEDVIFQALKSTEAEPRGNDEKRSEAIERLMAFGKKHGLSLGGLTIRELREEARP
jgi:Arc/MetJ-type ribon-helix-helix transcriptional regulator